LSRDPLQIEVAVALVYAVANLVIGWSGIALLACGLPGALPERRFDRNTVTFIKRISVARLLRHDSVTNGCDMAGDMRVGVAARDSPFSPLLVAIVEWLVHLPTGWCAWRLGI